MRTPNPQLREQRRAQILAAAARCFIDKGFHQASMAEIARASGLSMGLLYRYFRSKEEIVLAAAERERTDTLAAITALRAAATLRDALAAWTDAAVDAAFDSGYVRLVTEVLAEAGRNPTLLATLHAEDRLAIDALEAAFHTLQGRGLVSTRTPARVVATLFAACFEGIATRAILDDTLDRAALKAGLVEHWLHALTPVSGTSRSDRPADEAGSRSRRP
ncbi:MAG: TetR/AcrR family transcriptional regulator [Steroidobacteraceae bacterium]|nr:TetR/AcrR family transcriptional regulator [Steroidobacteraceae bacterium]